jgi:hypothetical protein
MQLQHAMGEIRSTIAHLKSGLERQDTDLKGDFRWTWGGLALAAVIFMGALVTGYFRLEDRQASLENRLTKIETKLDDMLSRMPPALLVPAPPPRR